MKYQAASLKTKKALAESLKKLMRAKPFSKITVTEIVNDSGVNRKTFYYHFEDIYALLSWIFEEEGVNILKQFDLINDYEGAVNFIIAYIDENRDLLRNAYDAFGSVELGRFFHKSFLGLTGKLIDSVEESQQLYLPEQTEKYLCEFLTEAASGMLLSNIAGASEMRSSELAVPVWNIVRYSIMGVLSEAGRPKKSVSDGE